MVFSVDLGICLRKLYKYFCQKTFGDKWLRIMCSEDVFDYYATAVISNREKLKLNTYLLLFTLKQWKSSNIKMRINFLDATNIMRWETLKKSHQHILTK